MNPNQITYYSQLEIYATSVGFYFSVYLENVAVYSEARLYSVHVVLLHGSHMNGHAAPASRRQQPTAADTEADTTTTTTTTTTTQHIASLLSLHCRRRLLLWLTGVSLKRVWFLRRQCGVRLPNEGVQRGRLVHVELSMENFREDVGDG